MTYKGTDAAWALNSYTWKLLRENLDFDFIKGTQGSIIVPVAQQPELMNLNRTFIVYASTIEPATHLYAHRSEHMVYIVYSPTVKEMQQTVNVIAEAFERQDEAAEDVNSWLAVERQATGRDRQIFFTSIRTLSAEKSEAPEDEGGYASGMVTMDMKYVLGPTGIKTGGFTYP